MKVYHGSKSIVKSPDVSFGRDNLDFGKGFYTTDLRESLRNLRKRSTSPKPKQWIYSTTQKPTNL